MNRRMFTVLMVLCAMIVTGIAPASAAYLQSNWCAELSNVYVFDGLYSGSKRSFPGVARDSSHIRVTISKNEEAQTSSALFSIPQSGQAPLGESATWIEMFLTPSLTMGSISFDYKTYWTQPYLTLDLIAWYMASDEGGIVWSSSRTGLRGGHVVIDAPTANGYEFRLTVIPEPSSILALGSFCALSMRSIARRRFSENGGEVPCIKRYFLFS